MINKKKQKNDEYLDDIVENDDPNVEYLDDEFEEDSTINESTN